MTTCNHCGNDPVSPQGMSATAIYHRRRGVKGTDDRPHDAGDFSRCVDYLGRVHPTWMRDVSPVWRALVDHWGELLDLYDEESGRAFRPMLGTRIRELAEEARP